MMLNIYWTCDIIAGNPDDVFDMTECTGMTAIAK